MDHLSSYNEEAARFSVRKKRPEKPQAAPAESEVVGGEIANNPEVPDDSQESDKDIKNEADEKAKEKAAELRREESYTKVDIALRKLLIEAGAADAVLSGAEAKALVKKMEDAVAEVPFYDGIFLDQMKDKGEAFIDTKRTAKITTSAGNEAVFKVMLKVDTGEFKLQGDVLDPKGQYAEKLMSP